jgi:ABC-type transport system substrate-binding protein
MHGYDPSISTARDLERAKAMIAKSSCRSGCTLTLTFAPTVLTWSDQAAALIRDNLRDIGINLKLLRTDATTFVTNVGGGKYQLALYGLLDFVNIPDGLLPYGLSATGGVVNANFTGYRSQRTEKLVTAVLTSSGARQKALLRQVNRVFLDDQPFATLATWTWVPAARVPTSLISVEHSGLLDVARE